jgi:hypothetical protein
MGKLLSRWRAVQKCESCWKTHKPQELNQPHLQEQGVRDDDLIDTEYGVASSPATRIELALST